MPHGVYPCRGQDRWCTIAVANEAQWHAFCRVIGTPEWTGDPRFSSVIGRKENEDELDRLIGEWTKDFTRGQVNLANKVHDDFPAGRDARGPGHPRTQQEGINALLLCTENANEITGSSMTLLPSNDSRRPSTFSQLEIAPDLLKLFKRSTQVLGNLICKDVGWRETG